MPPEPQPSTIGPKPSPEDRPPKLRIDWKASFRAFCEAHGRHWVYHAGRLLFSDGWTHSSTDYKGPEFPPPEDETKLKTLLFQYWRLRRKADLHELPFARGRLEGAIELSRYRESPLITVVTFKDDNGRSVNKRQPVDILALKMRVEWLEKDIKICDEELEKNKPEERGDGR